MKQFLTAVISSLVVLCLVVPSVHAGPVGAVTDPSPPPLPASPLIITAASIEPDGNGVRFVQIYNNSNSAASLLGWGLVWANELEIPLADKEMWIVPRGHIVIADESAMPTADILLPAGSFGVQDAMVQTLALIPPQSFGVSEHVIQLTSAQASADWVQRNPTSTGYSATVINTKTGAAEIEGRGLYTPPDDAAGLQIVEILANARNCSPAEVDIACNDFIKLYNPTNMTIELSDYRLRTDSGGLSSTGSNTFPLAGKLAPGAFKAVHLRSTGEPIAITNAGGYVWIEDVYGAARYEPIVQYPDAGATSKKGLSWALDYRNGQWKWMTPAPEGANHWVSESPGDVLAKAAGYADCGPGRERNPETNRCRNIVSASANLIPCREGQERNPETNRCRSVLAASATLQPCASNQFRNPETNRCKSIASNASALVPCSPGQERNPATNRCRKVAADADSIASVYDIHSDTRASSAGWFAAGAALLAALSYAAFEWRQDISQRFTVLRNQLRKK